MLHDRTTILFDLDGTLVDTAGDIAAALNDVLRQEGVEPHPVEQVREMIGDGAEVLIRRAFERRGRGAPDDGVERYVAYHVAHLADHSEVYPGIAELLGRLAAASPRRNLAVVTNKPTVLAEGVLEGLGLARHLAFVLGPESVGERKPSAVHVQAALDRFKVAAEDAVMVGDGTTDVRSGRGAGTATVAVLWGFRSLQELAAAEPDWLVGSVAELSSLLLA